MLLSVVVVNWNSREDLRACLDSLDRQTFRDFETIVVDNGSDDGSEAMVREHFPRCIVLQNGTNLGFAEGCNRGIDASHGEWVATLNNDTVADPRWAEALVDAIRTVPANVAMLQSLMLFLHSPDTVNTTGIELRRSGDGWDRLAGKARPRANGLEEIFCPSAGAAAYRRSMLDAVKLSAGYFDREHFMYYEDLDLGWRARLAGYSAMYVPESVVLHKYHGSSDRHGAAWLIEVSRLNRLRTILKNASPTFLALSVPATIKGAIEAVWYGGARVGKQLPRIVIESLAARRAVASMARGRRRALENRWANR